MTTYIWVITLSGIAEIMFRAYLLGTGTWRPSTLRESVIGLCVWIGLVLWGLYLLARAA